MKKILTLIIIVLFPAYAEESKTVKVKTANNAFLIKDGKKIVLRKGDRLGLDATVQIAENGNLKILYYKELYRPSKGKTYLISDILKGEKSTAEYKEKKNSSIGGVRAVDDKKSEKKQD